MDDLRKFGNSLPSIVLLYGKSFAVSTRAIPFKDSFSLIFEKCRVEFGRFPLLRAFFPHLPPQNQKLYGVFSPPVSKPSPGERPALVMKSSPFALEHPMRAFNASARRQISELRFFDRPEYEILDIVTAFTYRYNRFDNA